MGGASFLSFFLLFFGAVNFISWQHPFTSMSIFIVCLMLIQFGTNKKVDCIVKSAGVDPPGFQKWGGQDPPDPPVGDAPGSNCPNETFVSYRALFVTQQNTHIS